MANTQIFPQSVHPIVGDVKSTPGVPNITVTGIQTIPVIAGTPQDQQVLQYQSAINAWIAAFSPFNRSIQVNGVAMSDDYFVFVNFADTEVQVNSPYAPNGKPVLVNGV